MHWDAWLDDGKGEFPFGRPIRWMLFLYRRPRRAVHDPPQPRAPQSPLVQDVRTGALTYGHRFLAMSGRPGRAVKVAAFDDYKAAPRRALRRCSTAASGTTRIVRELDAHARRLGGRVHRAASTRRCCDEVPDLVEYPSVVAGAFYAGVPRRCPRRC